MNLKWPSLVSLPPVNIVLRERAHIIKVKDEIQLAHILKAAVQRLYKDLIQLVAQTSASSRSGSDYRSIGQRTWIKSNIPSSDSDESTIKTKYSVA